MSPQATATLKALGEQVADAVKSFVARAVEPLATRISAIENRTGALSMVMSGRGVADPGAVADVERVLARMKALEEMAERVEALERRHEKGDWDEGVTYRGGDVVFHRGAVWRCKAVATRKRPGLGVAWSKSR